MERAKGFEPSTSTLARWSSTTELSSLKNMPLDTSDTGIRISENGRSRGIRTHDPLIKSQLLYQLSYTPIVGAS